MKLKIALPFIIIFLLMATIQIWQTIFSNYCWENRYLNYWQLADKASTISEKQRRIDQFVGALSSGMEKGEFSTHNALVLKTPNNELVSNLDALKILQARLTEIKHMNPSSFEYQSAMQQITAQEQGEASAMLSVFEGCWTLHNYPICWDWIGLIFFFIWLFGILGLIAAVISY